MIAREYSAEQVIHFEKKAKHNKRESLWCFRIIMISTLTAPLFLSLAEGLWLSKILPSALSALAAFCTAWIQLRKPQELWSIYRNAQRQIEVHIAHFDFNVGQYKGLNESDAGTLLVSNVTTVLLETNARWMNQVPNISTLKVENAESEDLSK